MTRHSNPCLDRRRAGVLLHITSLPGPGLSGDLGAEAKNFVRFLNSAGITVWQTLPLGPTQLDGSPYQVSSVHAGNPSMIALEPLIEKGWLSADWPYLTDNTGDGKNRALREAWKNFKRKANSDECDQLARFLEQQGYWLEQYALFRALHDEQRCGWWNWPRPLRDRDSKALKEARKRLHDQIGYLYFEQFLFYQQWMELKRYANSFGIQMFGDIPIFVALDSAEVWAQREFFLLDEQGAPTVVAGVPPDYFSKTGQRWGNPLYHWEAMRKNDFAFWVDRLQTQLLLFDLVRIDHFRGFEACWAVPAHDPDAINGRWTPSPGVELFELLHDTFDPLPLVAEDLGIITPKVEALRERFGLPGMKVLQFAFSGEPDNPYLPFRHEENSVVYTGTHDNDTTLGWYRSLDMGTRSYVDEVLGYSSEPMPSPLLRAALASRARLAMLPMQDILALDSEHRMNTPGTTEGNWRWRFDWDQLDPGLAQRLRHTLWLYGRLAQS